LKGVDPVDLASWNHDDVSAALNGFADPYVSVDLEVVSYNGVSFVMIRMHEFEEVPVICRRDVPAPPGEKRPILRDGACYLRSRKKPESVEMPTQTEMRELLELAVDKGVRKFLRRAEAVSTMSGPTDEEQYGRELSGLR
jgi:hypothetical protein